MEDTGYKTFFVETSADGRTYSYEYPNSPENTVEEVKSRLRQTFCVRGGDISSRGDRMVVVNNFVAGRTYFFMDFRPQGKSIHCFPTTLLILSV